jgi:hypothetical protein
LINKNRDPLNVGHHIKNYRHFLKTLTINTTATAIASRVSSTMPRYKPIGMYMAKPANEIRVNITYKLSALINESKSVYLPSYTRPSKDSTFILSCVTSNRYSALILDFRLHINSAVVVAEYISKITIALFISLLFL